MSGADLLNLTVSELAPKIKAGMCLPWRSPRRPWAQADRLQPHLNSFITILHDQARSQAKRQEEALSQGEYLGPLHGIPIGIKDNISTAGIRTTVGSKVFADHFPDEDARVVTLCKDAGAIIWVKRTWRSSPQAPPPTTPITGRCTTPGSWTTYPAAPAAAARPTWPPASPSPPWVATWGVLCVYRAPSAAWWASSRPTAE